MSLNIGSRDPHNRKAFLMKVVSACLGTRPLVFAHDHHRSAGLVGKLLEIDVVIALEAQPLIQEDRSGSDEST
jgi:hypothetical protein